MLSGWEPFERCNRPLHRLWTQEPTLPDTDAAHARKELWKALQNGVEELAALAQKKDPPALALLLLRKRAGLVIAVVGPPVGFTAVLLGVLAVRLGWIAGPVRVDAFQVVGGVPQLAALWLAAGMLRRE